MQFQVQPPSENSAISKCFLIENDYDYTMSFDFTADTLRAGTSPFK